MASADITATQVLVAQTFFTLPEARGFLLSGGAALAMHGLIHRPTDDLDLFTGTPQSVLPAAQALVAVATDRGWRAEFHRAGETFCQVAVSIGSETVAVDLALDSVPANPPVATIAGPALDPLELAGRKMLALFGRALPRDLADVHALTNSYSKEQLLDAALAGDAGFDRRVFADMITGRLASTDDDRLRVTDPAGLREFYAQWVVELRNPTHPPTALGWSPDMGHDVGNRLPPAGLS